MDMKLNGQETTFSDEELTVILEKYFSKEATELPEDGKWFEVNPLAIDRRFFQKERKDEAQESVRQNILYAFGEMEKNPERYARKFRVMSPFNTWGNKKFEELMELAKELALKNADRVEVGFKWAQRIQNGDSWENLCNLAEYKRRCARLVIWKRGMDGYAVTIGGSYLWKKKRPSTFISDPYYFNPTYVFGYRGYEWTIYFQDVVPLLVKYEN